MKAINFLHTACSSSSSSAILPFIRNRYPNSFPNTTNFDRLNSSHVNPTPIPPLSSLASSTPATTFKPQTPIFLRPPIHSSTLSDLQTFTSWAKSLANEVGSSFVELDNGPDSCLLPRELRWLLEDSLDDPSVVDHLGIHGNEETDGSTRVFRLRVGLEDMYNLWKGRVERRRPFQYIVGCEHWRDLILSVEEGVLIPRPETGKIVEVVGDVARSNEHLKGGLWADLGTGSGALAIGIGRILDGNGRRVIATDLSPVAVAVTKFNVERYGLQDIIEVRQGSWFDPLMDFEGELSGLVSNPPYIPSVDLNGLQAEVGKHEPWLALDGGADGMDSLLHICQMAPRMLKSGGFFALETNGEEHCRVLASYMEKEAGRSSFRDVKILSDFAGIQRFVTGFRN